MLTADKNSICYLTVLGKIRVKTLVVTCYGLNYPQQKFQVSKRTSNRQTDFFFSSLRSVLLEYGEVLQLNNSPIQCSNMQEVVLFSFVSVLADTTFLYIDLLHYVEVSFDF